MSRDKPKLSGRPPAPQAVDEFLEAANRPRQATGAPKAKQAGAGASRASGRRSGRSRAGAAPPGSKGGGRALPWEDPARLAEVKGQFVLRMEPRHHAMLQWIAENTRRASMQSIALDLLEPAIEARARELLAELGEG